MRTEEIKRDITSTVGSWVNIADFARYMHWGRDRARAFLKGLPSVEGRYFANDIAKRLYERRVQ